MTQEPQFPTANEEVALVEPPALFFALVEAGDDCSSSEQLFF